MSNLDTLAFYAAIAKHLSGISSNITALADVYKNLSPRSSLDEDLIDVLASKADEMKAAALALKSVEYDPEDTESP